MKVIAITQIIFHQALDDVRKGIEKQLEASGYIKGSNLQIIFENAHGNIGTASQIAQKFLGLNPDVIVAISTPSAQTAIKAARVRNIPVIFAAITDPIAAGLIENYAHPQGNITGTYDFPPLKEQVDLMKKLFPKLKTLGVLFNPGEVNSVKQVSLLKKIAAQLRLKIVEVAALKTTEVLPAVQSIFGKVDALYVPQDNTAVAVLKGVAELCLNQKLPLFAPDPEGVKVGALATVGYSHFEEGLQTGKLIISVLEGTPTSSLPVEKPKNEKTYINIDTAKRLGLTLPESLLMHVEVIHLD